MDNRNNLWKLESVAEKGIYVREGFNGIYDKYEEEIESYEENDIYDILINIAMEIQAEEDISGEDFCREDIREMAMEKIVRELTKGDD